MGVLVFLEHLGGSLVLVRVTVPAWRGREMALCNRVGSMGTNLEVAPYITQGTTDGQDIPRCSLISLKVRNIRLCKGEEYWTGCRKGTYVVCRHGTWGCAQAWNMGLCAGMEHGVM